MNLANAFHHILEEFLDDIDNEDAETIADPDCPGCDGTGFSSWEECHPYGAGLASETSERPNHWAARRRLKPALGQTPHLVKFLAS